MRICLPGPGLEEDKKAASKKDAPQQPPTASSENDAPKNPSPPSAGDVSETGEATALPSVENRNQLRDRLSDSRRGTQGAPFSLQTAFIKTQSERLYQWPKAWSELIMEPFNKKLEALGLAREEQESEVSNSRGAPVTYVWVMRDCRPDISYSPLAQTWWKPCGGRGGCRWGTLGRLVVVVMMMMMMSY